MKTVLNEQQLAITIRRLSHQILESHEQLRDTVIIGIQPRGVFLSDHLVEELKKLVPPEAIKYGILDITFYRDDIRKELHVPNLAAYPRASAEQALALAYMAFQHARFTRRDYY